MKRNLIAEIKSLKEREKDSPMYWYQLRIDELHMAFNQLSENGLSRELYKHIPISLVATMESFFYTTVASIIDYGDPFLSNVVKFNQSKDIKFDFEVVKALNAKDLTIGNFIAHILPFNNLSDINSNLSVLLQVGFLDELKRYKRDSIFEHVVATSENFINDAENIIRSVVRTFELRHMFCHELAYDYIIDIEEIKNCLKNVDLFINQADIFIDGILHPNRPETQTDMNIKSYEDLVVQEAEIERLIHLSNQHYQRIHYEFNQKLFDRMIEAWKKYRDLKGEFDGEIVKGGSMWPLVVNNSKEHNTRLMIDYLKNEIENIEKL